MVHSISEGLLRLYFLQLVPTHEKTDDFYKAEGNIAVYVAPENSHDSLMIQAIARFERNRDVNQL